jgi:type IV secretion system protein VirB10
MKSKIIKKPDPELEEDDESVEVGIGGPSISTGKQSKIMIIVASSVLIAVVLYFLYFKSDSKPEKLQEVVAPKAESVASNEGGESPFAIAIPEDKSKTEVDLLVKPAAPDVPTLPDLPENAAVPDQITLPNQQDPQKPIDPSNPNAQQNGQNGQQQNNEQQQNGQQQNGQWNQQNNQQQNSQQQQPEKPKDVDPRYSPIIVFSGDATGAPARGVGYDKNIVKLNADPIDSLKQSAVGVVATHIKDRSNTIAQGKLLTAVLETAIHTEIPGSVRAIVSRDVYAESGSDVLIPRGSRLFGSYATRIVRGQGRVDVSWTRLIRPDGVDMAVGFKASDQFGRAGIPGDTDNKYGTIITNAMLTSAIAVGSVALVQGLMSNSNQSTTTTTNPSQGTTTSTGNATNQALAGVSKTIIDTMGQVLTNSLDTTPVIRIPQGTRITVVVNSDINIPKIGKK